MSKDNVTPLFQRRVAFYAKSKKEVTGKEWQDYSLQLTPGFASGVRIIKS